MVKVEWDKVTWYTKLLSLFAVIAIFFVGFDLGIYWEQTRAVSALVMTLPSSGMHETRTPPPIVTPPTETASSTTQSGTVSISAIDNNAIIPLSVGEPFTLDFGNTLLWSFVFNPATSVSKTSSADGQDVYALTASGTTTISATGRPMCNPGEACPQFIQLVTVTLVAK